MGKPPNKSCRDEEIDESSFLSDEILCQVWDRLDETMMQQQSNHKRPRDEPYSQRMTETPQKGPFSQLSESRAALERSSTLGSTSETPPRNLCETNTLSNTQTSSVARSSHQTTRKMNGTVSSHSTKYETPQKQEHVSKWASCRKQGTPRNPYKRQKAAGEMIHKPYSQSVVRCVTQSTSDTTPRKLFGAVHSSLHQDRKTQKQSSMSMLTPSDSDSSPEATKAVSGTDTKPRNPYAASRKTQSPNTAWTVSSESTLTMSSAPVSQGSQNSKSCVPDEFCNGVDDSMLCQLMEKFEREHGLQQTRVSPSEETEREREVQQSQMSISAESYRPRPTESVDTPPKRMRFEDAVAIDSPQDEVIKRQGPRPNGSVDTPQKRLRFEELIVIDSPHDEAIITQHDDVLGSPSLTQLVDGDAREQAKERHSAIYNMIKLRKQLEDYVNEKCAEKLRKNNSSDRLNDKIEYLRRTGEFPESLINAGGATVRKLGAPRGQ